MLKYGRRSPKRHPSIKLSHILKGAIPAYPPSEDYLLSVPANWQMLGNDSYGDCVAVGWANMRKFITDVLAAAEDYPNQDEVLAFYKTQNPGFPSEDQGMDIQTACEALVTNGGPDGVKAIAFASVDYTNQAEVKAALAIFGGLLLGINVQQENIDDFNAGRPWDYHPNGTLDGGHCVLAGGYLSQAADDLRFITWAQECSMTDSFWSNMVEEAWVVIWPEHLGSKEFMAGIDLQTLASDYHDLTGNVLPVQIPTPTPVVPTPAPTPAPTPQPGCIPGALQALFGKKNR